MDMSAKPLWYVFNQSELCSQEPPQYLLVKTADMNSCIRYVPESQNKPLFQNAEQPTERDPRIERAYKRGRLDERLSQQLLRSAT